MKITLLKQQVKDANRVSVFVDEAYSFSLTLDQILEEKIKKGSEVTEDRLEGLKQLSDEGKVRTRALEWLMLRPHSTSEFREYGFRKKIDKDLIEKLTQDFIDKGYLNDEKFAEWFAQQRFRKGKSSRSVYAELMSKGISGDIARSLTEATSDDSAALRQLIGKLRNRPRYKDSAKLTAYLIGKGFRYADVNQALEEQEETN